MGLCSVLHVFKKGLNILASVTESTCDLDNTNAEPVSITSISPVPAINSQIVAVPANRLRFADVSWHILEHVTISRLSD